MSTFNETDPRKSGPMAPGINDRMRIDWVSTDRLTQLEGDPRRYSAREIKKAEGVIRRFGIRVPVVITSDRCVLAHYIVVIVAKRLGVEQIPVVYADDLSPDERRMLSVGLNRFYELGEFDRTLLGELFIDLEVKVPDLSFEVMGFEQAEVDGVLLDCERRQEEPEKPIKGGQLPVTKVGDIWLLGKHRIACGDATDPGAYSRLLEGRAADMVFTDPPYGCPVDGFVSSRGHREFVQGSGEMDARELTDFFEHWCMQLKNYSVPGAVVELCIDWRSLHSLMNAAGPIFGDPINMAVWVKDRAGMGSFLRSQHELVLIYCTPGAIYRNNVELGRHGRNRTNVWKYPSAMSFRQSGAEGDLLDDHPTPKPKDMVADAILDCTARGAVVLDPFIGSGSTLIAAEKTGRVCRGMDLDPLYVDVAVRRWQAWTGRHAVHADDGRRFDNIAEETAVSPAGVSHD